MAASKTTARVLGGLVFVACIAVAGAGVWYVRTGGIQQDEEADEDDDDDDPADPKRDGGAHARGNKKPKPGHRRAKGGARAHASPAGPAGPAGPSGMSYEAAIAGNNLHLSPGSKDAPDLTDAQLAGPMRNATFLDACGVPSSSRVTVKVAIRNGHAVGVSVYSSPPNAQADGCVERRVRGLYWPSSAKMDSFVTTY